MVSERWRSTDSLLINLGFVKCNDLLSLKGDVSIGSTRSAMSIDRGEKCEKFFFFF